MLRALFLILFLPIIFSGCAGKHNIPAGPTMDLVAIKYDVGLAIARDFSKHEAAERSMREVLDHAPRFAEAHYNLAVALTHQDRWQEALTRFEQALAIMPNFELAITGRDLVQYAATNGQLPAGANVPRYCRQFHELYEHGC